MTKIKKSATTLNTENKQKSTITKQSDQSVVTRNQELENMLKRTLADYQNLEKRIEEERRLLSKLSAVLVMEKLLPILDNLENAQVHLKDDGLTLVIKQFKEVLTSEGVQEIEAAGQTFDPKLHEAVEIQQGENDNKIIKVLTRGYTLDNKVIRPAKVVVEQKSVNHQDEEKVEKTSEFGDYA